MALYLCGMAALDVMRYVRSINDGEIPGDVPRPRRLRSAVHTNAGLNELGDDAQRMLSHVQGPIEALVPSRNQMTRTHRLKTHLWSSHLPSGAFIDLGNGIYLSSPRFLFLQLAPIMSEIELIALGCELCGYYSRWKTPSTLRPSTEPTGHEGTTFELKPAITVQKLTAHMSQIENMRGGRAARKALDWVLDHSASPAETAVYLLLCLPRRMGGYGLPKPVLNVKVSVTTSTTHEVRYPDLFWAGCSLDVEYQSDLSHSGEWSRYRDSQRAVELEAERITVLPLTRLQLKDVDQFHAFATSVRRVMNRRSRPLSADWRARNLDLREKLLWQV